MDYSFANDALWQIKLTENDFSQFVQPYIGNGLIGTRVDRLIVGTDDAAPLCTISKAVYGTDGQVMLPAWNHVRCIIDGVCYTAYAGVHHLTHTLDLQTAVVTLEDQWEYLPGKSIAVTICEVIPRSVAMGSYLSIRLDHLPEGASIEFGLLGNHVAQDYTMAFSTPDASTLLGEYQTVKGDRPCSQALRWQFDTPMSHLAVNRETHSARITATLAGSQCLLHIYHGIGSYALGDDASGQALRVVDEMQQLGAARILAENARNWQEIWRDGIAFQGDEAMQSQMVLAHQFHLLCSLSEQVFPLGALGLSMPGWGGMQLWDADFWNFRGILPLWPSFAKSIVLYRKRLLETAQLHAYVNGYDGAWFPWMANDVGRNRTPVNYQDELHVNIWIAVAAWEYYQFTGDREFLRDTAWPIISNIADFFASRVVYAQDNLYHLPMVVGPDEGVCEVGAGRCHDHFLTNFGVQRVMEIALAGAEILGVTPRPCWKDIAEHVFFVAADAQGIIPEYSGYAGDHIKQADVILAFYPLEFPAEAETIINNINYYQSRVPMEGPLMSHQIASCLLMRLGRKTEGMALLFRKMSEFSRSAYHIPYECTCNDNNIMLTGIGGELQALIYGYYGCTLADTDAIPRIGQFNAGSNAS
jgi:trehalose/maltose hydrolase-like predicted phosphorylase